MRSRFTGVELGTEEGSAEVVVAEGVASWDVLAVAAALDFLLFFFLLCKVHVSIDHNDEGRGFND